MILMNTNKNDYKNFSEFYKSIFDKLKKHSNNFLNDINDKNLKLIKNTIYDYYYNY